MTTTLTNDVLSALKTEGITTVFGIVGGLLYPFFQAIEDDKDFTYIGAKHEEGAAFMADGFYRASGNVAIVAATSGPGATNLTTGIATAFADGIPMIVITGNAATSALGKGAAQETPRTGIDIVDMFRTITKYSANVSTAASFTHHFQHAMRAMHSGRKGPVHLNIPVDLWGQLAESTSYIPSDHRSYSRAFDPKEMERAINVLMAAKHPVFLVGSGVASSSAEQDVIHLANTLTALVATTPKAKNVFPETHRLSLGVFGNAGHNLARDAILGDQIDVLFTIGTSLGETSTYSWDAKLRPSKSLIQLDIDPLRIGRNYPVEVPLVGDAKAILEAINVGIEIMTGMDSDGTKPSSTWGATPRTSIVQEMDTPLHHDHNIPLTPQRWRTDLESILPENAIIFSDIGGHMLFNTHDLFLLPKQRFFLNLGFGSMGHGTVAPIGAAIALRNTHPFTPVFALVGDACFAMNGMELLTASEYNVPVIWIVENNGMHGITHHCSKQLNGGKPLNVATNRKPIRVAKIAAAMGLRTRVVDSPGQIQSAVLDLLSFREPGVIEVLVDPSVAPPIGSRLNTLAGFINEV